MNKKFVEEFSFILARRKLIKLQDIVSINRLFEESQNVSFENFLIEEGIVDKDDLLQALAAYYQVQPLDVVGAIFEHHIVRGFPKDVMLEHLFIPYRRENDDLFVIAADPTNNHTRSVIGNYVDYHVVFMVGLPQDIKNVIREFYDQSITYQPYPIANQLMERSQQAVYPKGKELKKKDDENDRIPHVWEETNDDYES